MARSLTLVPGGAGVDEAADALQRGISVVAPQNVGGVKPGGAERGEAVLIDKASGGVRSGRRSRRSRRRRRRPRQARQVLPQRPAQPPDCVRRVRSRSDARPSRLRRETQAAQTVTRASARRRQGTAPPPAPRSSDSRSAGCSGSRASAPPALPHRRGLGRCRSRGRLRSAVLSAFLSAGRPAPGQTGAARISARRPAPRRTCCCPALQGRRRSCRAGRREYPTARPRRPAPDGSGSATARP